MKSPWRREKNKHSLDEMYSSVHVPKNVGFWKKFFAFSGPGLMVAVGYMDPGNWATDIAGGSQFEYTLLSVILISSLFAMVLQHLALKLGIATDRDLAQACRDHYQPKTNFGLWVLSEIAIAATDLAEVIGAAIAINLLFGIPLTWGIVITILDVIAILFLQSKGFRVFESIVGGLILVIFICFGYEIIISKPDLVPLLNGLIPQKEIVSNSTMLYVAIGILGATVMPHNLYLHSSIVQTRNYDRTEEGKKEAIKFSTIDSNLSLFFAFFVNAAILILSAAAFHGSGNRNVADIHDAYKLLTPILGTSLASVFFGIALLASGLNSTLTGTLAGQIVMEGFLNIRLKPWLRRLITRLIAVLPALVVAVFYGEHGIGQLLVLSQVILSLQLSFAVIPLIKFTDDPDKMGSFANGKILKIVSWAIASVIVLLNLFLVYQVFFGDQVEF